MAIVATVRIRHRSGKERVINASDYLQHIQTYANKGWRVVGNTRGEDDKPIEIRGATLAETDQRPHAVVEVALPLPTAETVARELLQSTAGGALTPPRQRRQRKRDDPRPE
jgi:hypothetical protein